MSNNSKKSKHSRKNNSDEESEKSRCENENRKKTCVKNLNQLLEQGSEGRVKVKSKLGGDGEKVSAPNKSARVEKAVKKSSVSFNSDRDRGRSESQSSGAQLDTHVEEESVKQTKKPTVQSKFSKSLPSLYKTRHQSVSNVSTASISLVYKGTEASFETFCEILTNPDRNKALSARISCIKKNTVIFKFCVVDYS